MALAQYSATRTIARGHCDRKREYEILFSNDYYDSCQRNHLIATLVFSSIVVATTSSQMSLIHFDYPIGDSPGALN